jgi:hypothetical protein
MEHPIVLTLEIKQLFYFFVIVLFEHGGAENIANLGQKEKWRSEGRHSKFYIEDIILPLW